ncbi:hypothetical protein F3Y22_tig00110387pilonHSYRG00889 [Hibiscus syriacus]|uniref:Aldehyde dehydrogenase domain-containing protein n=1 Tax=Hibiscus syriacus TaxID=106335 RepID=A0A6A3AR59_HIBSY|nr:hypothetical protein F3Y22_tig00110387pilonHSYRG00889 [Hibiscus syriacus]
MYFCVESFSTVLLNQSSLNHSENVCSKESHHCCIAEKIEESIEFINSKPNPLVICAFTEDETFKKQILSETSSGSVTFNDSMIQFLCDSLPFGGVGQSGFGRYHGKYSFDTFSHEKSVLQRAFYPELEPRYPPWTNFKLMFIKLAYGFDYFGLLLLMLDFRKS